MKLNQRIALLALLIVPTGCGLSVDSLPTSVADLDSAFDEPEVLPHELPLAQSIDPDALPYPHRNNPFVPLTGATEVTTSTLQIKGFVDVEQPLAMLSIDDRVVLVAPGDRIADLRIVSVEPPGVVVEQHNATRRLTFRR